ncbi:hypothetical protein Riv7116_4591 [Rivularia sp. PCC 7116]|uniref:hypothetical protein n=1 Tax=Rivularia sp. PCC 7116 TaxID=373994 RepID=UPI00029F244A|nr:hypothetical protein [Rivularia sp. PCC 7116]AFY57010.1 hypothetical protein Riv7116_4591 [Rivularia sp. PCC 7116]
MSLRVEQSETKQSQGFAIIHSGQKLSTRHATNRFFATDDISEQQLSLQGRG